MRITFALPPVDLSGGIRVISIHAENLRQRGHQVVAVSVSPSWPTLRDIARIVLKQRRWPFPKRNGPSHFDGLPVEHRRLPHDGPITDADLPDADVVIATWWETARWVDRLSPNKGAKVHFVQGYDIYGGPPEEIDATYAMPLPKIVISGWLRDLLQDKFHQKAFALVHNSVDTGKFHAPQRGKQARPTVGMIYATEFNKGCDIQLKAFELAAQQLPNLRLVAMGNYRPIATLPLPAGADFTFQARDQKLRETYARCDVWLFGTRQEGFGLPILEAMACRTPVVGTPAGAAPELIGKGGGILVPHENPQAMADALVKVCSLPETEWRALSDTALATVTGYTWDDATTHFEKALEQVIEVQAS